jgi:hypothetical protein
MTPSNAGRRTVAGHRRAIAGLLVAIAIGLVVPPALVVAGPMERSEPTASRVHDQATRKIALGVATPYGMQVKKLRRLTTSLGGHKPAIWVVWSRWGEKATREFPTEVVERVAAFGVTPMIWWEPADPARPNRAWYPRFANTAAGNHDAYIRRFARKAKAFGRTVLLRYAPEPNGRHHPWGSDQFDNSPAHFTAAWRHVWEIFVKVGATNVKFVWSVSTQRRCGPGCNQYQPWHPGDTYVDYSSFSSFNWGTPRPWRTMLSLAEPTSSDIDAFTDRPLIIIESASNSEGGDKAAWIREGYPAVHATLPSIAAVVYLNADLRSTGHPDWRIASPPAALDAYRGVAAQPEFQGRFKKRTGGTIADAVGS